MTSANPPVVGLADLPPPPAGGLPIVSLDALPPPPSSVSPWQARGESFLTGLEDPISGGAQLLTHVLPTSVVNKGNALNNWLAAKTGMFPHIGPGGLDALQAQREAALQRDRASAGQTGFDWPRLAGNALPWVAAPGLSADTVGGRAALGAASGGLQGLLQPDQGGPGYATRATERTLLGAGTGGVLPVLTHGAAGIIRGVQDPAVNALSKAGIPMTPGQVFGGPVRAMEEKLSSVPFLGDLIKSGERRGLIKFNRAAVEQAVEPAGIHIPADVPEGRPMIEAAGRQLSERYDRLLPKLQGNLDEPFVGDLAKIRQLGQTLPPERATQLDAFIKNDILAHFNQQTGRALGTSMKDVESKLGSEARAYYRSLDPDQRKLGAALLSMQLSLRKMLERNNPQYAGELQKLNTSYARFLRVEGAASRVGAEDGVFTPAQLRASVRQLDPTRGKRAFARGRAVMQPLAEQGQKVLAKKVPDSGTAGRAFATAMALGAPGLIHPALGLGAAGAAVYNPLTERLIQSLATGQRGRVSNALAALLQGVPTPALTAAAIPLLPGSNQP